MATGRARARGWPWPWGRPRTASPTRGCAARRAARNWRRLGLVVDRRASQGHAAAGRGRCGSGHPDNPACQPRACPQRTCGGGDRASVHASSPLAPCPRPASARSRRNTLGGWPRPPPRTRRRCPHPPRSAARPGVRPSRCLRTSRRPHPPHRRCWPKPLLRLRVFPVPPPPRPPPRIDRDHPRRPW